MRVGLIAPPWLTVPPRGYGGTEIVVDGLARGLVAAGHEVLLAAPDDSTCPVPRVPGLGTSQPQRMGESAVELAHLVPSYAAMGGVDVIHDHTFFGPLYRHRPAHVPIVMTRHDPFPPELCRMFRTVQRDTAIVAVSRHQASLAAGVHVSRVIPHGLDVAALPVGPGSGGYACFLGRMSPDKGAREAVLVARQAGIPIRLAAKMRAPAEYEYFRSQVEPLLGRDAQYLGEITGAEKYELLGDAIALVNPITWPEPFGLVMIEALATGTPVVGRPEGAAPEIVDEGVTGYLRTRTDDLAEALGRAAGLDRAACRQAAEVRFSTARMVADHLALYRQLLDRRWKPVTAGAVPIARRPEPAGP